MLIKWTVIWNVSKVQSMGQSNVNAFSYYFRQRAQV